MKKKGFIKLYNSFSDITSKYYLTPDELYTYSYLKMLQTNSNDMMININFLSEVMDVPFYKNQTKHKQTVKQCFNSLVAKGIIIVSDTSYNDKDILIVNFKESNFGVGHEQMKSQQIRSYKDAYQLYIHFVVSRYKNTEKGVFDCSYDEWKEILGISSVNTAIRYIDSCIKEGLIYKNIGDYSGDQARDGQKKQKKNQYSLTPFSDENKGSVQHNQESDTNTPNESISVSEEILEGNNDMSGWGESPTKDILSDIDKAIQSFKTYDNHFPEVEDYKQYLLVKDDPVTQEEKELVKVAEKRMKQMKKYYVDKGLDQAQQSIIDEQQEIEREEQKQYEDKLINDINNGQLVVKRDDKDVYLDGVDALLVTDSIYKCHYLPDPFGGGKYSLDNIDVEEIVKEEDDGFGNYHVYSDGVLDQLLPKFKELYAGSKDFDIYAIKQEMKRYRDELIETINNSKEIDEFHEGDLFSEDDDRNISLAIRITEIKKAN